MATTSLRTPRPTGRLSLDSAGLSMTVEEFDAADDWDEDYRYELIRGVLVVSPPASNAEIDPNEELGFLLRLYKRDNPQGRVLDKTLSEQTLRTTNRRRADRAIWIGLGRVPDVRADFPAILVEFVSPGRKAYRRDYEEKRDEYLAAGAREYWVVDRFRRTLTVFRTLPEGVVEQTVRESETYRTDLLPGFELPLAGLLAAADDWSDSSTGGDG